ncbi:hypothetical protein PTTG_29283 [Puccinia triticina 1-1 BBBD Race 1]|uniref:Uncharacterized protein n=2 Tax=Puccinia triticina TaxID=208348 RepID=A0A180G580_PUCT1|nr:uncharacterized protein PtA15_13A308 [Puccinia triticina]OAV87778.1 hypothetical protein PTTG_29283 [Puccinia triticina 1-1 BBBD Race 1]WAQ90908.1 hypothetical protein PtA15_13A308 [Puccinia triticina]
MSDLRFTDFSDDSPDPQDRITNRSTVRGLSAVVDRVIFYCRAESRQVTALMERLERKVEELAAAVERLSSNDPNMAGTAHADANGVDAPQPNDVAITESDTTDTTHDSGMVSETTYDSGMVSETTHGHGMVALTNLVKDVAANVTRAAVHSMVEKCELFEGISEEDEARLYLAAGIPPPAPDAIGGMLESYELQLGTVVSRTLAALERGAWEQEDEFKSEFLGQLARTHRLGAQSNGLWWRRVCELRRLAILNLDAQGENPASDVMPPADGLRNEHAGEGEAALFQVEPDLPSESDAIEEVEGAAIGLRGDQGRAIPKRAVDDGAEAEGSSKRPRLD